MPPVPDSRELGVPAVAGRTLSSALSPGRPRLGIPPAGSGSDAMGMSEPSSASVPVKLVTTPVSVGAEAARASRRRVARQRADAAQRGGQTAEDAAEPEVGRRGRAADSCAESRSRARAGTGTGTRSAARRRPSTRQVGQGGRHRPGLGRQPLQRRHALRERARQRRQRRGRSAAAVPLVDPAPSCRLARRRAADWSGAAAEASGWAAAGLMVKAPPRPPRKAPTAAQASPPAPTMAALR